MELDLQLFYDFEKGLAPSILRIYSWKPKCISLGYSQKAEEEIDFEKASSLGWDVVRRPTGGGIVFHNEAEVTYSLVTAIENPLLPKGLVPSYKRISEAVIYSLRKLGIEAQIKKTRDWRPATTRLSSSKSRDSLCFSSPVEYEVVLGGRKIVGSAQKRGKKALLQQGSIFVRNLSREDFVVLKKPFGEYNAVSVEEALGREVGFGELSEVLIRGFEEVLGVKFK